jgi:hypothetical protein
MCCSQSPNKSFVCYPPLLLLFVLACSVSNEYARESDDFYTPKNEVCLPSLYSVLVARRDATTTRVKVRLIR